MPGSLRRPARPHEVLLSSYRAISPIRTANQSV